MCAVLLGNKQVALRLAELEWPDLPASTGVAYLWNLHGNHLALSDAVDPRTHLALLAEELADQLGKVEDARLWAGRAEAA